MNRQHLPSGQNPGLPLCGRLLSRDALLSFRDQRSMIVSSLAQPELNAHLRAPVKPCRHCLRAAGLLPPLARSRRYDPDAETLALSDDELTDALGKEGEEG